MTGSGVQAHATTSHRPLVGQVGALQRGALPAARECSSHAHRPPAGSNLAIQDQRNAPWHSVACGRRLAEVPANGPCWVTTTEGAGVTVPGAALNRPDTFGGQEPIAHVRPVADGAFPPPPGRLVASHAVERAAHHAAEPNAWIARQRPSGAEVA